MPATTPCPPPAGHRTSRPRTRPTRRPRAVAAAAVVLALLAGLVACSGEAEPEADPAPSATPTQAPQEPPPLATTVRLGEVVGRVPVPVRQAAVRRVRAAVDRWIDGAYVAGPWPRRDFSAGFATFTAGARQQARGEIRLLSNAGIGTRVESVRATRRRVVVDVLSERRRPAAATARVQLAYRTDGQVARTFTVRGRLFLTPTGDGWRVFGYDLAKGTR